jgi:hypothetical protein
MDLAIMHKNLWAWLAEDPMRQKHEWPGFVDACVRSNCMACEHAYLSGTGKDLCDFCPLEGAAKALLGNKYDKGQCLGGLYTEYTMSAESYRHYKELTDDVEETEKMRVATVKAAETIRDLEWKE